jgi:nitroimidazol reductase NimA-like FMN-containing flavoprotein (pyridoxamine 5'-phosphate oxidase superfamily)
VSAFLPRQDDVQPPPSVRPPTASTADHAAAAEPYSERVRLRRKRERGRYDRQTIDAILDEALIAHLGIVDESGQPIVTPTLHARAGEVVYCHGSAASRTLRSLATGAPACLTVTLLDGLVLARAAMHHSANYRSVMLLGQAHVVEDRDEKRAALRAIVEHIVPGRSADVRGPSENELKATSVLAFAIAEASAKIRAGGPIDDEEDYALPAWAGVIPLASEPLAPEPDPRLPAGVAPPAYVTRYARPGGP